MNEAILFYTFFPLPSAYEVLVGRAIKSGVKPQPDDSYGGVILHKTVLPYGKVRFQPFYLSGIGSCRIQLRNNLARVSKVIFFYIIRS